MRSGTLRQVLNQIELRHPIRRDVSLDDLCRALAQATGGAVEWSVDLDNPPGYRPLDELNRYDRLPIRPTVLDVVLALTEGPWDLVIHPWPTIWAAKSESGWIVTVCDRSGLEDRFKARRMEIAR